MKPISFAKIPLAGNELQYLTEVLESGWLTTSAKAFTFEKLFAEKVGAKYACAVNSCTAALHLALEAIGIKKGDQVVVQSALKLSGNCLLSKWRRLFCSTRLNRPSTICRTNCSENFQMPASKLFLPV